MNINKKNTKYLNTELSKLLREEFKLRMQSSTNLQLYKFHLLKQVRYNIARLKTLLTEKNGTL